MSLSWPDHLHITIGSREVTATIPRAPWRRHAVTHCWPVSSDPPAPWAGALAALTTGLPILPPLRRVSVTVANAFLRYTVLRIPATLDPSERANFIAHKLRAQFGDTAQQWTARTSDTGADGRCLVAAMPSALIHELQTALGPAGAHAAIEPALVPAFNAARRALRTTSGWIVMLEAGHAVVGWQANGHWITVASRTLRDGTTATLFRIIDRESLLNDVGAGAGDVYLLPGSTTLESLGGDDPRYRLHPLPHTLAPAGDDRALAA